MKDKIRVIILFGGKSAEHEVSILSARNVYQALDKNKYDVTLVGIDRDGQWYLNRDAEALLNTSNPALLTLNEAGPRVMLTSSQRGSMLIDISKGQAQEKTIDVVFPVLHGPMGEDGTIQGLLKLLDIPFVGPSVLGSAVGMDKDVMKRLMKEAGIPVADFITIKKKDLKSLNLADIVSRFGLPVFVKPANMGSSVGVSKVRNFDQLLPALDNAFQYDTKVLVEEAIIGREIECSVLGNESPRASLPGEVVNHTEFYSYESKYVDPQGATTQIPADLPPHLVAKIQELAIKTFQVLECEGMARVDFFLQSDGKALVNEINTIPGFTKISMYPKMWEASGLSYSELIHELIRLAIERHKRDSQIKVVPDLGDKTFNA